MIITDAGIWPGRLDKSDILIQDDGTLRPCDGCFRCWTNSMGVCGIPDRLQKVPALLMQCDSLILVSRCTFGSVSPFVKNVLDRLMPLVTHEMTAKAGGHVHKSRFARPFTVDCYFYGSDLSQEEKVLAKKLVEETFSQLHGKVDRVAFYHDAVSIGELR